MENAPEKLVVRKKRIVIAQNLRLTKKYIKLFKKEGILTKDMLEQIEHEPSNFAKIIKFMELLSLICTPVMFENFCEILEDEHKWVSEELKAEWKAERGELQVEEYIHREAGIIVQRRFGDIQRLTIMEKKELQTLLAYRTQFAKEVWSHCLTRGKTELAVERQLKALRAKRLNDLYDKISIFARLNQKRLRCRDKKVTKELKTKINFGELQKKSKIKQIDEHIALNFELCETVFAERESLMEERVRALTTLECTDLSVQMDEEIQKALDVQVAELLVRKQDMEEKHRKAKELHQEVTEIKTEAQRAIDERKKKLVALNGHVDKCQKRVGQLNKDILNLLQQCEDVSAELNVYKLRAESLEKNRRLGYIYDKSEHGKLEVTTPPSPVKLLTKKASFKGAIKAINMSNQKDLSYV